MLLRLHPAAPHPTIHFAVAFDNLDERLPVPANWTSQLQALSMDDLEFPRHVHALDKASSLPCLLDEVVFNVPLGQIFCTFIDKSTQILDLPPKCLALLESVADDVSESAIQSERERERVRERVRERQQSESLNSPPASLKLKGHKKQRSLLMSLVASIIIPLSPSSRNSSPVTPEFELPPTPPLEGEPAIIHSGRPRALRRRARSTLVDAFRLSVQPELNARLPSGGFYTWVVESMLRRTSIQMEQLVTSSGIRPSSLLEARGYFNTSDSVLPSLVSEDDSEADNDTDWSSVHTPSTQHSLPLHIKESHDHLSHTGQSSTPSEITACKVLSQTCVRLRHLLNLASARHIHAESERRQREAMLEIRSRRRAWLNKSLAGGTRSNMDFGFALPFRNSRIAQVSWSGEDYEFVGCDPEEFSIVFEEYQEYEERLGNGSRKTRSKSDNRLFPVSEEEELEDDMHMLTMNDDWPMHIEDVEASQPIRRRRRSLSASSITYQPIQTKEKDSLVHSVQGAHYSYGYAGDEEFTLAMDLPFSVRIDDRSIFEKRKLRSSLDLPTDPEPDWFPRTPPGVNCR